MNKAKFRAAHLPPLYKWYSNVLLTIFNVYVLIYICIFPDSLTAYQAETVNISLSMVIDRTETPLNVPVNITAVLSWEGNPDRYRIAPPENPSLINLEVVGSATTSKTELRDGKVYTIKEFTFSLQPVELGMGYIESFIIEYTDTATDSKDYLFTQRMGVKGLSPVYENNGSLTLVGIALLVFTGMLTGLLFFRRHRRIERKLEEEQPERIEDTVCEHLKTIHAQNNLSFMQKLDGVIGEFRSFFIKKFSIPEGSRTDKRIIEIIKSSGVTENITTKVQSIFEQAEQIRFSGREIKNDDFELLFGEIESCVELCVNYNTIEED